MSHTHTASTHTCAPCLFVCLSLSLHLFSRSIHSFLLFLLSRPLSSKAMPASSHTFPVCAYVLSLHLDRSRTTFQKQFYFLFLTLYLYICSVVRRMRHAPPLSLDEQARYNERNVRTLGASALIYVTKKQKIK